MNFHNPFLLTKHQLCLAQFHTPADSNLKSKNHPEINGSPANRYGAEQKLADSVNMLASKLALT